MNASGFRTRIVLVTALTLAVTSLSAQQPVKAELPKPLPAELAKAWASVGWTRGPESGTPSFMRKAEPGYVPMFQFRNNWKDGRIAKLPMPDTPFVIDLASTQVTDAGLKELAAFAAIPGRS